MKTVPDSNTQRHATVPSGLVIINPDKVDGASRCNLHSLYFNTLYMVHKSLCYSPAILRVAIFSLVSSSAQAN